MIPQPRPPASQRPRPPQLPQAKALVGPETLIWLYRRWLRTYAVQELLAGVGVAIAVALVFATLVASSSIAGSAGEVAHTVTGPASLQLHSRSPSGIPESLVSQARNLPGVKDAAPLLEQTATLTRANQSATVNLAGADLGLVVLDGLAHTIPRDTLVSGGIGLSAATAARLGMPARRQPSTSEGEVTLKLGGRSHRLAVSAVLGEETFGALSQAVVAVMPLSRLQRLADMPGRVSRILIETRPGQTAHVRKELSALADGQIDVASADQDVAMLRQALRPSDQASAFFATISALLGVLLAIGAILLTAPARRRVIAELRLLGSRRTAIVQMFLFQALTLGAASSLIGLIIGYGLSMSLIRFSPHYLAEAFTLGSHTEITATPLIAAVASGMASTCLATAIPLLDLRESEHSDGPYTASGAPGNALSRRTQLALMAIAATMALSATILFLTTPALALLGCGLLSVATVLAVPLALRCVLAAGRAVAARRKRLTILPVVLSSLQATALRSLAFAATGAAALFGAVALSGSRADLAQGIAGFARSYANDASIWVGTPSDDQAVVTFAAGNLPAKIAKLSGVKGVRTFQGGFMQIGGRRVWVIARPPGAFKSVLATQQLASSASPSLLERRLSEGGWIAISKQIAEQQHTGVGGKLTLPTPSGETRLKIAALTTNLAWSPGAMFIGRRDYQRLWRTSAPTALAVTLKAGAQPSAVAVRIQRIIGPGGALRARTADQLRDDIDSLTGEGLRQLREISLILLIAAILAMAAALTSAIWQRRSALAGLRLTGAGPPRLRRILLGESTLMLAAGCITGALAGFYGQAVIDRYLARVTGFPVAGVATGAHPVEIFALVVALVLAITAAPVVAASNVSPRMAFEE